MVEQLFTEHTYMKYFIAFSYKFAVDFQRYEPIPMTTALGFSHGQELSSRQQLIWRSDVRKVFITSTPIAHTNLLVKNRTNESE